jgi:hypothetical protein
MTGAGRFETLWCLECIRRRVFFLDILILGDETTALPQNVYDTSKSDGGSVCAFFDLRRSSVELNSIALFVVQGPMSSSYRHSVLQCFMLVSLTSCFLVAAFELWRLEILGNINLDHTVGILKNNWECKRLNIMRHFPEASANSVMIYFSWHFFYSTYSPPYLRFS